MSEYPQGFPYRHWWQKSLKRSDQYFLAELKRVDKTDPEESVTRVLATFERLSDALITYTAKITVAAESLAESAKKLEGLSEIDAQAKRDFPNGTPPYIGVEYGYKDR